jgi:hypothetical protein
MISIPRSISLASIAFKFVERYAIQLGIDQFGGLDDVNETRNGAFIAIRIPAGPGPRSDRVAPDADCAGS